MKKFNILENVLDLSFTIQDKTSKIYCKNCQRMLPLFRLILKSKSCKNNCIFQFKCRKCKYVNMIKKEVIK
jgi:hypothetical protein